MGLNNMNTFAGVNAPGRLPIMPHLPRNGEPTMMSVNLKPLVQSDIASPTSFVFRKDSAGLGVPREELGKLDKFSQRTLEKGTASTPVYFEAPASGAVSGRPANAAVVMTSIHRGSPAPSSEEAASQMGRAGGGSGNATMSSAPSSARSMASSGHSH